MFTSLRLCVPAQEAVRTHAAQTLIRQLRHGERVLEGTVGPWSRRGVQGALVQAAATTALLVPKDVSPPPGVTEVLVVSDSVIAGALRSDSEVDARAGRWIAPRRDVLPADLAGWAGRLQAIRASWDGQFAFKAEQRSGDAVLVEGLRPPQLGALHAVLAHWTVTTSEPATIVMPTGTGKTETMLATLVAARPERLLVVVPTDALREQVAGKFLGFGLLSTSA